MSFIFKYPSFCDSTGASIEVLRIRRQACYSTNVANFDIEMIYWVPTANWQHFRNTFKRWLQGIAALGTKSISCLIVQTGGWINWQNLIHFTSKPAWSRVVDFSMHFWISLKWIEKSRFSLQLLSWISIFWASLVCILLTQTFYGGMLLMYCGTEILV